METLDLVDFFNEKNNSILLSDINGKRLVCTKPINLKSLRMISCLNNSIDLDSISFLRDALLNYEYSILVDSTSHNNVLINGSHLEDLNRFKTLYKNGFVDVRGSKNKIVTCFVDGYFNPILLQGNDNSVLSCQMSDSYGDTIRITGQGNDVFGNQSLFNEPYYPYDEYHVDHLQIHPPKGSHFINQTRVIGNIFSSENPLVQGILISDGCLTNSEIVGNIINVNHVIGIHSNCTINSLVKGNIGSFNSTIKMDLHKKEIIEESKGNTIEENIGFIG